MTFSSSLNYLVVWQSCIPVRTLNIICVRKDFSSWYPAIFPNLWKWPTLLSIQLHSLTPSSLAQPTFCDKNLKFQIGTQFSSLILHLQLATFLSSGHFCLGGFKEIFFFLIKGERYGRRVFLYFCFVFFVCFPATPFSFWGSCEKIWCLELWLPFCDYETSLRIKGIAIGLMKKKAGIIFIL